MCKLNSWESKEVHDTKRIIIEIDEVADAEILVILKKVFTNAVSLFSYIQVANSSM